LSEEKSVCAQFRKMKLNLIFLLSASLTCSSYPTSFLPHTEATQSVDGRSTSQSVHETLDPNLSKTIPQRSRPSLKNPFTKNASKANSLVPTPKPVPTSVALLQKMNPKYKNLFNRTHPLLLIGLPKTGTTSLTGLLLSLGVQVAHQYLNTKYCSEVSFPIPDVTVDNNVTWKRVEKKAPVCYVNHFMQHDLSKDLDDPLRSLFNTETYVVTQFDTCLDSLSVWPQIDALSFLLRAYPHASYLHSIRDPVAHVESILHWNDLSDRMNRTGLFNRFEGQSPTNKSKAKNIEIFIRKAQEIVRHQFEKYPSHKYLEIDMTKLSNASITELTKFLQLNVPSGFSFPHSNKGKKESKTPRSHQPQTTASTPKLI
jgi:hypothetical protein